MIYDDMKAAEEQEKEFEQYLETTDPDRFLMKAKRLAARSLPSADPDADPREGLSVDQMYIVWFSKTLQNWKALVSTDAYDEFDTTMPSYVEVTYDGNEKRTYVDVYVKSAHFEYNDIQR